MSLTPQQIQTICRLTDKVTGIQWDSSKDYLIESRIVARLAEFGCTTLDALIARIDAGDLAAKNAFIDAVTTRETLFFRDESPYIALEHKALPEIIDAKTSSYYPKRLRLWSAAASTGQEAYSLAICLLEMLPDVLNWDVQILATDISDAALATASRGIYSDFEVGRGLRPDLLNKYFQKVPNGWQVKDEVRSLVTFQKRNLLQPFDGLGPFDVLFCRYVAIYFDMPVRRELFERLSRSMTADGCLFVGASENLSDFGSKWAPQFHCRAVYYQPNKARTAFSLQPQTASSASAAPAASKSSAVPAPVSKMARILAPMK